MPSRNALHMTATAARVVDAVFAPLAVRRNFLKVPKRLRWYLKRESSAVSVFNPGPALSCVFRHRTTGTG